MPRRAPQPPRTSRAPPGGRPSWQTGSTVASLRPRLQPRALQQRCHYKPPAEQAGGAAHSDYFGGRVLNGQVSWGRDVAEGRDPLASPRCGAVADTRESQKLVNRARCERAAREMDQWYGRAVGVGSLPLRRNAVTRRWSTPAHGGRPCLQKDISCQLRRTRRRLQHRGAVQRPRYVRCCCGRRCRAGAGAGAPAGASAARIERHAG